ncbi:MAG TPA: hypothetical protein VLA37_02995 [Sphingomonadaceae bacterium]|nr:hypothetical protein [Sphingomonadaceae bacterium]
MLERALIAGAAASLAASPAWAESADHYRGGWLSESGEPHVYEFVIKGDRVGGIYCSNCADGTTLARIAGSFDEAEGLAFTIRHLALDGSLVSQDEVTARLVGGQLLVSGIRGGEAFEHIAIKDPRGPTPGPYPQAMFPPGSPPVEITEGGFGGGPPAPYLQPAPWRQIAADDVVGVWLGFGVGLHKQYFFIRRDGDELWGLACGRCDNPYTFGALTNFAIEGDTLTFDIEHEDWGEGSTLPFARHVTARITMNEMRIDARRDDVPGGAPIVASLVGPIAIEATRGNVVGD